MYESTIILKGNQTATYDAYGNETITYEETTVAAMPVSVYRNEFYSAAQAGLHPSITFDISTRADYAGQKIVEWNGVEYDVIRADWSGQRDRIRLVCEERTGDR